MRSSTKRALSRVAAFAASAGVLGSLALAGPALAGTPAGLACQPDGKINGRGATFQKNAQNNAFATGYRRQTRQLALDLNQQGKTIFFSSHSISELEKLAHRVGILVEGAMVRLLTQDEWKNRPGRLEELFIETLEASGASLPA